MSGKSSSEETHLTAEDVIEKVRQEHGDAIAELVAKDIREGQPSKKGPRRRRVGNKPKPSVAIPQTKSNEPGWSDMDGTWWETADRRNNRRKQETAARAQERREQRGR